MGFYDNEPNEKFLLSLERVESFSTPPYAVPMGMDLSAISLGRMEGRFAAAAIDPAIRQEVLRNYNGE